MLITRAAVVNIDGAEAGRVPWRGPGVSFEVAPGHHTVSATFWYGGKYRGLASIEVDVAPDQEVALLYRSPWVVTMKGSLKVR